MDFFGRQDRARRASHWLVVAFIAAVAIVVVAVNLVVLAIVIGWTAENPFLLLSPGEWLALHPGTFWTTTTLVTAAIVGISLRKTIELRAGGKVVARDLGAQLVSGHATDPVQRQLLNVVEEMAIASSVPVPAVYVLESRAMNALAAGYSPATASLVVTRGALLALDRAELQGVIGHEFSHILNGDMRLYTRLVGFLHGLFIVSELGRWLGPGSVDRDGVSLRRGGFLLWAGIALFAIGSIGLLVGRLLQAAVARQRERLADAASVQFTRESRGLRNALVKVGSHKFGSRLNQSGIDRVSHMLFASAGRFDFATHQPLIERIRALDPTFQATEFGPMRYLLDAREAATRANERTDPAVDVEQPGGSLTAPIPASASAVTGLVGNPGPRHVQFAAELRRAMPGAVERAARDPQDARDLLLAIAVGTADRDERLACLRLQAGVETERRVQSVLAVAESLPVMQRLPAVLMLMRPLRQLSAVERHELTGMINRLMSRGGTPTVFGYALRKSAMTFLSDEIGPPRDRWRLPLRNAREDLRVVLSVVARNGTDRDPQAAHLAFTAGWARLGLPSSWPMQAAMPWVVPMDRAVARLDRLASRDKECVIQALTDTIARDGRVNVAEAELLRLFCALLHCPLPPLMAGT